MSFFDRRKLKDRKGVNINITLSTMTNEIKTTVVTAGDKAYAWGVLLLVASMRKNGMGHPVVVGAMEWTDKMKSLV